MRTPRVMLGDCKTVSPLHEISMQRGFLWIVAPWHKEYIPHVEQSDAKTARTFYCPSC